MSSVTPSLPFEPKRVAVRLACLVVLGSLGACSSLNDALSSDKVDYRSGARQTDGLDIPPDLTQLARNSRQSPSATGSVSAAALQQQAAATGAVASSTSRDSQVALNKAGDVQLERNGDSRWLRTSLPADQVWDSTRSFWQELGFSLVKDQAELGVLETSWAENRAKLPQDVIRQTIGKVLDSFYSTGERDMFRTRIERRADGGSDIYIAHRGMQEVYTSNARDTTSWQPRPADPLLEAEMLSRLMLRLGGKAVTVGSDAAAATPAVVAPLADARQRRDVPDSLSVAEGFERAWRRVGQSLDRHGFTVEDRDRNQGLFFLRYADPNRVGKEEPNFFERLFKGDKAEASQRYRVQVKSQGELSTVSVLDEKGQQQTGEIAKRILGLLMDDLR